MGRMDSVYIVLPVISSLVVTELGHRPSQHAPLCRFSLGVAVPVSGVVTTMEKDGIAASRRQALMTKRGSETALPEEQDHKEVEQRDHTALQALMDGSDEQLSNVINTRELQKGQA